MWCCLSLKTRKLPKQGQNKGQRGELGTYLGPSVFLGSYEEVIVMSKHIISRQLNYTMVQFYAVVHYIIIVEKNLKTSTTKVLCRQIYKKKKKEEQFYFIYRS